MTYQTNTALVNSMIKKADSVLNFGVNGKLALEQENQFIEYMVNKATFLKDIRVTTMKTEEKQIDKLGILSQILLPAVEGTKLDSADYGKVDTGRVKLVSKEVIAVLDLSKRTVEDAIEKEGVNFNAGRFQSPGGIHSRILKLIAERASLDLQDLAINGDTTLDPAVSKRNKLLSMNDGFLKLAGNVYDAQNTAISAKVIDNVTQLMPEQYLNDPTAYRYIMSTHTEARLRSKLADRNTNGGDSFLQSRNPIVLSYGDTKAVAAMPATKVLYVNPQQLIFGIQRGIVIDLDYNPYERKYYFILTARVDFKVEETTAMVRCDNLSTAALS